MSDEIVQKRFKAFDSDGTGFITMADYSSQAHRLIEAVGEASDSPRAQAVLDAFEKSWQALVAAADKDGDHRVDLAEFTDVVRSPDLFDSQVKPRLSAVFDLCDKSGDGMMDQSEYTALETAMGRDADAVGEEFRTLTSTGAGLDKQTFIEQVRKTYGGLA